MASGKFFHISDVRNLNADLAHEYCDFNYAVLHRKIRILKVTMLGILSFRITDVSLRQKEFRFGLHHLTVGFRDSTIHGQVQPMGPVEKLVLSEDESKCYVAHGLHISVCWSFYVLEILTAFLRTLCV